MINLYSKIAADLVAQRQSARKVDVVDWIDGNFRLDFEHAGQGCFICLVVLGLEIVRQADTILCCKDQLAVLVVVWSRESRMCTGRYLH